MELSLQRLGSLLATDTLLSKETSLLFLNISASPAKRFSKLSRAAALPASGCQSPGVDVFQTQRHQRTKRTKELERPFVSLELRPVGRLVENGADKSIDSEFQLQLAELPQCLVYPSAS